MRKALVRFYCLLLGLLAAFGFYNNASAATNNNTDSIKKNPLYLIHANESQWKGNNAINWHASHESHYSHQSHHSHYSSYN